MKKFFAVIAIALVVAVALWVALRVQLANREATVAELLPKTTLLLAQVADFNRTREQWHGSDLYQIWREPSVQAWLQKPLSQIPHDRGGRKTLQEFFQLGLRHAFVALTSIENNEPKLMVGFHFEQSPEKARTFIEEREAEWLPKSGDAQRATIRYEQHKIETVRFSRFNLASVYDGHWFFAANNLEALKALLDRADRRSEKAGVSLQDNEAFSAAAKQLPGEYAVMAFIDPQPFVQKLLPLIAMTGQSLPMQQLERLKQVRGIAAAFGFDRGKMRETDFVAMPQLNPEQKLGRPSLATASANTFLYSTSLMHWPENLLGPSAATPISLPAIVRQFATALSGQGISQSDLRQAFGQELEVIGQWPPDAHWPIFLATLPVTDRARARKIADALTSVEIAGAPWTSNESNGAAFYSVQRGGGLVPLNPAIVVSEKVFIAGTDSATVEAALTTSAQPAGALEKSAPFREAAAQLPAAGSAFNYIDTRLLFERADAAVRPLLSMGALLYPALGRTIDPAKFPPKEAIAKHLSPIVMSQRYGSDGYITESIGPITFHQATIGLAGAIGGLFFYLQEGLKPGGLLRSGPANASPPAVVPPAPSSAESP